MKETVFKVIASTASAKPPVTVHIDAIDNIPQLNENEVLQSVLNWAYLGIGMLSVVMLIYAGVQYVTSEGDPGKTATAQRTITYSIIGLIVAIAAAAITNFVLGAF